MLLAHLDHEAVRRVAREFFAPGYPLLAITESSVPLLVRWMRSKDDNTRSLAITILGKAIAYEPKGKKEKSYQEIFLQSVAKEQKEMVIVDALTQELFEGDPPRREAAALLLGTLGPWAKSAVPALVRAELWDNATALAASDALARIKPTPAERLPGLLRELKDDKSYSLVAAATKLGEMGADAKIAVADLLTEIKKTLAPNRITTLQKRASTSAWPL